MRRGHDPTRSVRILDSVVGVDVRLADRLAVLMAGEAEPQSRPSHISCVSATGLVSNARSRTVMRNSVRERPTAWESFRRGSRLVGRAPTHRGRVLRNLGP